MLPRRPDSVAERVAAFAPVLRAFVGRRVDCPATADDLTQDTLLKALSARQTLRDEARLEAWLFQTARRTMIDHQRRCRPKIADTEPDSLPDAPAHADAVTAAVARAARCYLGTLPPAYQEAVRLAEEDGLAHGEVARRLGISLTAAKSRIRRGKQQIRELIEACCQLKFDAHGRVIDYEVRRCGGCR